MGESDPDQVVPVPGLESAAQVGTPHVFVQAPRDWLVEGFRLALDRFRQAAGRPSETAKESFWPLLEALNWVASILDYHERALEEPLEDPLSEAIRFARVRVHHYWAAALDPVQSHAQPISDKPSVQSFNVAWHWKPVDQLPTEGSRRGESHYRDLLAGHPAQEALTEFAALLAEK